MVSIIQEKSPLKSVLVRAAASLSPQNMALKPEELKIKFSGLDGHIYSKQRVTDSVADDAKTE